MKQFSSFGDFNDLTNELFTVQFQTFTLNNLNPDRLIHCIEFESYNDAIQFIRSSYFDSHCVLVSFNCWIPGNIDDFVEVYNS